MGINRKMLKILSLSHEGLIGYLNDLSDIFILLTNGKWKTPKETYFSHLDPSFTIKRAIRKVQIAQYRIRINSRWEMIVRPTF